jgi:peptide/nickel transport system permease protein
VAARSTTARVAPPPIEPLTVPLQAHLQHSRNPLSQALRRTVRNPMGAFGLTVVVLLCLMSILAPLIAPYGPAEQIPGARLRPPSAQFLFGTDHLGRDLLSRVIFGAQASLTVGLLAVAIGGFVGVGSGLVAGYLGGWVDAAIMRFYDALLAFPGILLAIGLVVVLGPGIINVALAIGIGQMPMDARLTRSIVLSQRERDYVTAARALGAGGHRIMLAHILPNTLPPLLVQFSLAMGFAVLAEAALSFLGLGTQPPTPSWGSMLNESRTYLRMAPWFGIWPGVALALLLIALNYLADALRDALDPRRINARS